MGTEIILYAYCAVCVSMLVFNIVYNIMLKSEDKISNKRVEFFSVLVKEQTKYIYDSGEIDFKHLRYLNRKLMHVNNLIAFNQVLENILKQDNAKEYQIYYKKLESLVLKLGIEYVERQNMQAAYFAYFVANYSSMIEELITPLQHILVNYMTKDSLYCRLNALRALYNYGSEERIVESIVLLDSQNSFIHEKLLTDGLVSYKGDYKHLIELFWDKFYTFSLKTQLSILNFIRFKTGDFKKQMLFIMNNTKLDKELRLSAIRYFDRYPSDRVLAYLLEFAKDKDLSNWEYTAIAITSLAKYKSDEVKKVLLDCLHSSNWYIRKNAATSLEKQDLNKEDLKYIARSKDRYAIEMLIYRLEKRKAKVSL